tara:strand:- start:7 stop:381 length:375 start_codon:yes stop_codon:yes gene_type:complete
MDSNTIIKALRYAKDSQGWSHNFAVKGDEINETNYSESIEWLKGKDNAGVSIRVDEPQISWSDLQPFITQAEEYYTSIAHQRPRARAYPSIQEQLDMMYHDQVNNTTTWKDAIEKVKADYPKEE